MSRRIDFHTHTFNWDVMAESGPHSVITGFGARPWEPEPERRGVVDRGTDPELVLAEMSQRRVDVHVLTASMVFMGTSWADADHALALNRRLNEQSAEWQQAFPDRFIGSLTLPLQDVELALTELGRAVDELALRVVNLPAQVNGDYLGHPRFHPLWREIESRGLVAFVHPEGVTDPWFQQYSTWNSVGQPIEETKVLVSLMYEGVLDAHPGLKIVVAHGGGYFPHYFGRLDRNVTNFPPSAANISKLPSEYRSFFYYDTCVFAEEVLVRLADVVGVERLIMGSDYAVGEPDPIGFLERCDFGGAELDAIAGGNAERLLA